jgi:carbonic anhydrase/acetyltransferase-like protein (isoleucine patch superfamily)
MLIEHEGKRPRISPRAYVAPTAVVCGDVTIGDDSRVLFNAVITAEGGSVDIGSRCIIMEHALIRGRTRHPTHIANNVLIGPHAHVNGAVIEENAFVATGASVFPGTTIGSRAEVRVNGVVHVNTTLAADALVPIGWVAVGDPAEILPTSEHDRIWAIQERLDFPGTVFGLSRPPTGKTIMPEAMRLYAERFGRHRGDTVVEVGL